jgi:hypothetical protein
MGQTQTLGTSAMSACSDYSAATTVQQLQCSQQQQVLTWGAFDCSSSFEAVYQVSGGKTAWLSPLHDFRYSRCNPFNADSRTRPTSVKLLQSLHSKDCNPVSCATSADAASPKAAPATLKRSRVPCSFSRGARLAPKVITPLSVSSVKPGQLAATLQRQRC